MCTNMQDMVIMAVRNIKTVKHASVFDMYQRYLTCKMRLNFQSNFSQMAIDNVITRDFPI